MRVAIIGSGIAGNGAAYALTQAGHQVAVYEREPRVGGHSATVDVDYDGKVMSVDTGFIVYNDLNYPNLVALFARLGVATEASNMSFSVSADGGAFEWAGRDDAVMAGLFAQKRNLLRPSYLMMLRGILRFQQKARADFAAGTIGEGTLGDWLDRNNFHGRLRDDYIVPMGAAIWSMSPKAMLGYPALSMIAFFENHRLLQWSRPVWRTVTGGSRAYVEKLTAGFAKDIRLGTEVVGVTRKAGHVEVTDAQGHRDTFDHVIIAAHAPQALAMLGDASAAERRVLGAMRTAANAVYLHRDTALMPKRRAAWASWNFLREGRDETRAVALTYWMNRLQNLDATRPLFVTLNPYAPPDPAKTFARFEYHHPQYDAACIAAQAGLAAINGVNRTHFCGAWTSNGFHEAGLASGLAAAAALGARAPWSGASQSQGEAAAALKEAAANLREAAE